jgi:hypothetical protein
MEAGLFLIHAVVGAFVAAHGSQKVFGILGVHSLLPLLELSAPDRQRFRGQSADRG